MSSTASASDGTSATFRDSHAFTVLAVTWAAGEPTTAPAVRARYHDDGGWSPWGKLDPISLPERGEGHGPAGPRTSAATGPRAGTEPLIAPGSDGYEVQVSSPAGLPAGLLVIAVDSSSSASRATAGSAATASTLTSATTTSAALTTTGWPDASTSTSATASTSTSTAMSTSADATSTTLSTSPIEPPIKTRADWGANENFRNCPPEYAPELKAVAVHHTAGRNDYTADEVPGIIDGIYILHTDDSGLAWCDIGYNALVDRFGVLWEGRFGGLDQPVVPAAQNGFNTGTSAISALGDYGTAMPTSVMQDSIAAFAAWKLDLAHIDPATTTVMVSQATTTESKYPNGTSVTLPVIFGHLDVGKTLCPGTNLSSALPSIRSAARARWLQAQVSLTRIAGADRVATSIAGSQRLFGAAGTPTAAGAVVLATSQVFADGLGGGSLAAAKNGPLLLTRGTSLDSRVATEITRVLPKGGTVYLLGGEGALSSAVASAVTSLGMTPVRLAGADRYATAVLVAGRIGTPATLMLTTGLNFPDALGAAPAAVKTGGAVLLTKDATMPTATKNYLAAHTTATQYAIGGAAAQAAAYLPADRKIVGTDRFDTSVRTARAFFPSSPLPVAFTSGTNFPDALSGGAYAGAKSSPILLVTSTSVPSVVTAYLSENSRSYGDSVVLGGAGVIADSVLTSLRSAMLR